MAHAVITVPSKQSETTWSVTTLVDGAVNLADLQGITNKTIDLAETAIALVKDPSLQERIGDAIAISARERYNQVENKDVPPADGDVIVKVWNKALPISIGCEDSLAVAYQTLQLGLALLKERDDVAYNTAMRMIGNPRKDTPTPPDDNSVTPDTPARGIRGGAQLSVSEYGGIKGIYSATLNPAQKVLYVPAQGGSKTPHDLATQPYNYKDTDWMVIGKSYSYAVWKVTMQDNGIRMDFGRSDKPMGSILVFHPKEGAEFGNKAYDGALELINRAQEDVVVTNNLATVVKKNEKGYVNPTRLYFYTVEEK